MISGGGFFGSDALPLSESKCVLEIGRERVLPPADFRMEPFPMQHVSLDALPPRVGLIKRCMNIRSIRHLHSTLAVVSQFEFGVGNMVLYHG